ncbi:MAG: hypothetical protein H0W84_10075 [Bacteroidetes bacterium]|nr:hypothetical protein [Bacteroidota bacterium]
MKTKILFFALISILVNSQSFAQIITFTLLKTCGSNERQAFTDEFAKKRFYIVEEAVKKTKNKVMEGATFYCNEKERDLGIAEIDVLSVIKGTKKITEISFLKGSKHDYAKNYGDLYTQMGSMFSKLPSFQSKKYKTEVTAFTKDQVYYYSFKVNDVPIIVISNYKIDQEYF